MSILQHIQSPRDLLPLSYAELTALAGELRAQILQTVSTNGGHLSSNLGILELTLAVHRVFDSPNDQIVFDVGHQAYVHKLLTGRQQRFSTIRQQGGISGFTKRDESPHDPFGAGHAGTSVSAALGLAHAHKLSGSDATVVAIVGDGAFTNGMIYEAINNCAKQKLRLIILLNDNEMSISQNVGGFSGYLANLRTSRSYFSFKHSLEATLSQVPVLGKGLCAGAKGVKHTCKKIFLSNTYFEHLGINYLGPIDGCDQERLETVLREAASWQECSLIHVHTHKGKGYPPAQEHPDTYHSVGPFDLQKGILPSPLARNFSQEFGDILCDIAARRTDLCAITAAMRDGTGLARFAKTYPQRFYDVGIAEEHAVTFAAGLSAGGKLPVVALYATFLQRVYDQLIHDAAIQDLPLVLALDRAGFVPGDGVTHQGVFDVAMLSSVPGIHIYCPETYAQLRVALERALSDNAISALRYAKGRQQEYDRTPLVDHGDLLCGDFGASPQVCILTYGRTTRNACEAGALLQPDVAVRVVQLFKLLPLPADALFAACDGAKLLYLLEEGVQNGGIAQQIAAAHALRGGRAKVLIRTVGDAYRTQGNVQQLDQRAGFLPRQIADEVRQHL